MKKPLVKKWVKALRSDKYVQGDGALRQRNEEEFGGPDEFCCLGVLCDLVEPERWSKRAYLGRVNFGEKPSGEDTFNNRGLPSQDFLEQVGLEPNLAIALAELNDDGKSFSKIADYIEEKLLV